MHVIAGRARNVPLGCPKGTSVRPMLARVRDALCNIFQRTVADGTVLDLFSGCGSAGIEALSRGATWCVFVERDRRARLALEDNLARTRLAEFCDVVEGDVFGCLGRLRRLGRRFDLVVADPPYPLWQDDAGRADLSDLVDRLVEEGLTGAPSYWVVHHDPKAPTPQATGRWVLDEQRTYGRSALSIFALAEAEPASS